MKISRTMEAKILEEYKELAHKIYKLNAICALGEKVDVPTLRLIIGEVIQKHINSQTRAELKRKGRVSKNKITREVNKQANILIGKKYPIQAKELSWE